VGNRAEQNGRVTSMRRWLIERRDFDRLRQLRPWGIGSVVQHDVTVGESRERPGQLRIERGWRPRTWLVVRCLDCGHQWDDDNPDDEVCACLDKHGGRRVVVVSAGASNV
jgi:hypothetical protein